MGDELKLSYSLIWLISGEVCENWLRFLGSMCQFVLLLYGRLIFDIQFLQYYSKLEFSRFCM